MFQCHFICNPRCHWNGTQTASSYKGIDLFLAKHIVNLCSKDSTGYAYCKGQKSANYYTQGLTFKEYIMGHGGSYRQSKKDGGGIHYRTACCICQTTGKGAKFLDKVTKEQHTKQRHRRRNNNGSYYTQGNREDNLDQLQVLNLIL